MNLKFIRFAVIEFLSSTLLLLYVLKGFYWLSPVREFNIFISTVSIKFLSGQFEVVFPIEFESLGHELDDKVSSNSR